MKPETTPIWTRFWGKVDICSKDECWLWKAVQSGRKNLKYGQFRVGNRMRPAHQVAWELMKGEIPKGLKCLHECDNPLCVNPNHLFLGTSLDNTKDMIAKGRSVHLKGEECTWAKVTETEVLDIRKKYSTGNFTLLDLGKIFNVHRDTIRDIVRRATWKHVFE